MFIQNLSLGKSPMQINLWDFNVSLLPGKIVEVKGYTFEEALNKSEMLRNLVDKKIIGEVLNNKSETRARLEEAANRATNDGQKVKVIDKAEHPRDKEKKETVTLKRKIDGQDVGIPIMKNNMLVMTAPEGESEIMPAEGDVGEIQIKGSKEGTVVQVFGEPKAEDFQEVIQAQIRAEKLKDGTTVMRVQDVDTSKVKEEVVAEEVLTTPIAKRAPKEILNAPSKCSGKNARGKPCGKAPLTGSHFCSAHISAFEKDKYDKERNG